MMEIGQNIVNDIKEKCKNDRTPNAKYYSIFINDKIPKTHNINGIKNEIFKIKK